jgi:Uncharacterized conserved protein, contains double-stranded beta-helix domain
MLMKNKSRDTFHFQGIATGKQWSFKNLLKPYPHQVISQQLLKRSDYQMLVFFFDKREGIGTDIQYQDILYVVEEGEMIITTKEMKYHLKSGECMVISSGCEHAMEALKRVWLIQITITGNRETSMKGGKMDTQDLIKNIEKGKSQNLKELVAYQEHKVASLTLIQKDMFSTTIMALDKGTGVGPHICEGDALVIALEGEGDVMIGKEHKSVTAGQCIVMPAGIVHAVSGSVDRFKMLLVVSKPE